MKQIKNITLLLFVALFTNSLIAQTGEVYNVPLSNPGQPGELKINLHNGSINVEGYSGNEVIVKFAKIENKGRNHDHKESDSKRGLRKIPNQYIGMEIVEDNNKVYIKGEHHRQANLLIQVPKNFTLNLKTHHNGDVKVKGVNGEIEVNSHHGEILMEDIGGSVVANTHHGEIKVNFLNITPNKPMAFSTYHGDVDIAFPAGLNCETKIKTARGDIYTDFDFELQSKVENQKSDSGRRKIKIGGWMYGKIGSGGEEFLFNTYHGDVVIRKS